MKLVAFTAGIIAAAGGALLIIEDGFHPLWLAYVVIGLAGILLNLND